MTGLNIDEYCSKILVVLTLRKDKVHFNELHGELKKRGMGFSKPTLVTHLNHLVERDYVTRKEEKDSQYVTYSLNLEKMSKLKGFAERTQRILKSLRSTKKEFYSLTEEQQVGTMLSIEIERKLEEIEALIDLALDPDNPDKKIAVSFMETPMLRSAEVWIVQKCREDSDYRKKILCSIEEWRKRVK